MNKIINYAYVPEQHIVQERKVIKGFRIKKVPNFWDLLNTRIDVAILYWLSKQLNYCNLESFTEYLPPVKSSTYKVIEINIQKIALRIRENINQYKYRTGKYPDKVLVGCEEYRELMCDIVVREQVMFAEANTKILFGVDIVIRPDIDGIVCI